METSQVVTDQILVLSYFSDGRRHVGGKVVEVVNPEKFVVRVFHKDRAEQLSLRLEKSGKWRGQGVSYMFRPPNEKETATIANMMTANVPLINFDKCPEEAAVEPRKRTVGTPGSNTCLCGCGMATSGNFAPGHDAKIHGLVNKVLRGQESAANIPVAVIEARGKIKFIVNHPESKALLDSLAPTISREV